MKIGSLFSGIGGLEKGLELSGLGEVVWQCENNDFCRKVLAKHWPGVPIFGDITQLWDVPPVDLVCGGFPCQNVSSAGKQEGLSGARSGLWYQFERIVALSEPSYVIVENVASGAKKWVCPVRHALHELGYDTTAVRVAAEDVGAPHRRARIFIIAVLADRDSQGQRQRGGPIREEWGWTRNSREGRGGQFTPPSEQRERGGSRQQPRRGGWTDRQKAWLASDRDEELAHNKSERWTERRTELSWEQGGSEPTRSRPASPHPALGDGDGEGLEGRRLPQRERRGEQPARETNRERAGGADRSALAGVGGVALRIPDRLHGVRGLIDNHLGWPAPRGPEQFFFEPPRTVPPRTVKNRTERLSALGNAVVPQVAKVVGLMLLDIIQRRLRTNPKS